MFCLKVQFWKIQTWTNNFISVLPSMEVVVVEADRFVYFWSVKHVFEIRFVLDHREKSPRANLW